MKLSIICVTMILFKLSIIFVAMALCKQSIIFVTMSLFKLSIIFVTINLLVKVIEVFAYKDSEPTRFIEMIYTIVKLL